MTLVRIQKTAMTQTSRMGDLDSSLLTKFLRIHFSVFADPVDMSKLGPLICIFGSEGEQEMPYYPEGRWRRGRHILRF